MTGIYVDDINESTSAHGVEIDGVSLKDSEIASGSIGTAVTGGVMKTVTTVATTSGTSIDFTSIPSGVNKVWLTLYYVSLSGTNQINIQLGDAGGVDTSGYWATSLWPNSDGNPSYVNSTSAFPIFQADAGRYATGEIVFTKTADDKWGASGLGKSADSSMWIMGGYHELTNSPGDLTTVRVKSSSSDTFDSGQIRLMYMI